MRQIFVNLPAKEFERSKQFLSSLGTPRAIADARSTREVLRALSCSSDKAVDDLIAKGFMYDRSFEDPDGPIRELLHMDGEPQ